MIVDLSNVNTLSDTMKAIDEALRGIQITEVFEVEPSDRYSFISPEEEVDYLRIVKEAPKGTNFIVVEETNRFTHRSTGWVLLVHNDVLKDQRVFRHYLAGESVTKDWGAKENGNTEFFSYRFVFGEGKFPREIYQDIERIKKLLSPKDTKTFVTYK